MGSTRINFSRIFRITWWCVVTLGKMSPINLLVVLVSNSIRELRPLISTLVLATLIDKILVTIDQGGEISDIYELIIVYALVTFGLSTVNSIRSYSSLRIRNLFRLKGKELVFRKMHELGVEELENPIVADSANRVSEEYMFMYEFLDRLLIVLSAAITGIVSGLIVWGFSPAVVIACLSIAFINFWVSRYFMKLNFRWWFENSERRRIASSVAAKISDSKTLKEVAITGSYDYLKDKYLVFTDYFLGHWFKLRRNWELANVAPNLLELFIRIYAYINVFAQLIAQTITVGGTLFNIRAIDSLIDVMFTLSQRINSAYEFSLKLNDAYEFFQLEPTHPKGKIVLDPSQTIGIQIKDLTFRYPNTDINIFSDFNMTIKPGENIAIVGENGAGKTTLVKLITKLYRPTSGEILVNNQNLNEVDSDSWHQHIGVLFQDYNHYESLSAADNIIVGRPGIDVELDKIKEAAQKADALSFIEKYPHRFDQIMSEKYTDGIRPSGGQMQKLAIARFFYRNAPLAIFDEPTAAIDAVSEAKIFNQIYEFFRDRTVIIISHRFSTVRNADRIIVLDAGRVVEEGSHEDLMALGGKYAHAFQLQAEGYKDKL